MGLNRPMRPYQKRRALEMAFKARLPLIIRKAIRAQKDNPVLKMKYTPLARARSNGRNIYYSVIDEVHSYGFGGAGNGKEADEPQ